MSLMKGVLVTPSNDATTPLSVTPTGTGSGGTAATPQFEQAVGSPSIASGQVAVTTSATQVVGARAGRRSVTLSSATAVAYWIGAAGVTVGNGYSVPATAGAGVTISTTGAVFAIGAAAVTITYFETF